MPDLIVLVNGLPGAGKTTLATALAAELNRPLLSKDAVKEALAATVDVRALDAAVLGPAALAALWTLVAGTSGTVLVESWWFAPRDGAALRADLARCGSPRVAEIWCSVPAELARERFAGRTRAAYHRDEQALAHWPEWAARARPVGVGQVLRVDTSGAVDVAELADRIRRL